MEILDWIRREIEARGITQGDFRRAIGWSSSEATKVLGGQRRLRADELLDILRYFGVPSPIGEQSTAQVAARHLATLQPAQQAALLALVRAMQTPEG